MTIACPTYGQPTSWRATGNDPRPVDVATNVCLSGGKWRALVERIERNPENMLCDTLLRRDVRAALGKPPNEKGNRPA